jgi:hypothetical protein
MELKIFDFNTGHQIDVIELNKPIKHDQVTTRIEAYYHLKLSLFKNPVESDIKLIFKVED